MAETTEEVPEELQEALDELDQKCWREQAEQGQLSEAFTVRDPGSADWVVGKLAALADEADRVREQFSARMAQIKTDKTALLWRFGQPLEVWTANAIASGKRKSVILPHGTVGFRTVPEGLDVVDEPAALEAAKRLVPEAVMQLEEYVVTKPLLAYLKRTGECVPGTKRRPASERWFWK